MIFETIISSTDKKNKVNFSPFGIKKDKQYIYISPYIPSKTLDNLIDTGCAVINYVNDASLFVDCVIGNKTNIEKRKSTKLKGFFLKNALSYDEVRVIKYKDDKIRPTFKCEVVNTVFKKPFLGINRAANAIIEACILATRTNILNQTKIITELNYLKIAVEKTSGKKELEAWKKINKYILKRI
tara:strand:- start:725 stop:1276 length:552 start_codon:yes stop_codon:yes gene_type:complete